MTFSTGAAVLAATGSLLAAGPAPKITLSAPNHAPKVGTHWSYSVHVTLAGKPAAARLTERIRDPIGGLHPVQFGTSTKNIANWPFKGTFKDFIVWPASSRGVPLTLEVTVRVGKRSVTKSYSVTPRT